MTFHFLDKDMIKKNNDFDDLAITGICRSYMIPLQEKNISLNWKQYRE